MNIEDLSKYYNKASKPLGNLIPKFQVKLVYVKYKKAN